MHAPRLKPLKNLLVSKVNVNGVGSKVTADLKMVLHSPLVRKIELTL